jgi:CO/xanthine dehydrogenase FAD-binding subunit
LKEVEMAKKDVRFFAPQTMDETLHILAEYRENVSVLAGGTDLVRNMNLRKESPDNILWIGRTRLEYIRRDDGLIHIGAATRMQMAAESELLLTKALAVARAAGKIASPSVRSLATLGGNICTASPAADSVCGMMGMGAEVLLATARGNRLVPLADFFTGPGKTVRKPDELLVEIQIVPCGIGEGASYAKMGRRASMTLAVLNTACRVKVDENGKCVAVVIAIGAAAPTPLRATKAEKILLGQPFTEEAIMEAANVASGEIKPIDDVHGTAWYRRKITRVMVARTLREAGGLEGVK